MLNMSAMPRLQLGPVRYDRGRSLMGNGMFRHRGHPKVSMARTTASAKQRQLAAEGK